MITGNLSAEVPYPGKDILIYNNKSGNLTLKHDGSGTADVKFLLENGVDLVVPAGGKVWLKYGPSYCEMIFKSWTEIDLSTKLDKVSTTGVERVYTINADGSQGTKAASDFKEVTEGYFYGTNFYTDAGFTNLITPESGKIYVALDTNLQYRWSGSAYVKIGGVSESDLYSYWFSYTASHVTSAILYTQVANAILTTSGTQSIISRVGTNLYNSYHFLNWVSAAANGSNAGVKINNNVDVPYRAGVEAYIIFGNNSGNVNHVTAVGSYGSLS